MTRKVRTPRSAVLVPGYGGAPTQPLLVALGSALGAAGISTKAVALGKGGPSAQYAKEISTVRQAAEGLARGASPVALVGRSFGGRLCAFLAAKEPVAALVVLGWPIRPPGKRRVLDEEALLALRCRTLIVQGAKDELGPLRVLRPLVAKNPLVELHVLPGARHAWGRPLEREVAEFVAQWLRKSP